MMMTMMRERDVRSVPRLETSMKSDGSEQGKSRVRDAWAVTPSPATCVVIPRATIFTPLPPALASSSLSFACLSQ